MQTIKGLLLWLTFMALILTWFAIQRAQLERIDEGIAGANAILNQLEDAGIEKARAGGLSFYQGSTRNSNSSSKLHRETYLG